MRKGKEERKRKGTLPGIIKLQNQATVFGQQHTADPCDLEAQEWITDPAAPPPLPGHCKLSPFWTE